RCVTNRTSPQAGWTNQMVDCPGPVCSTAGSDDSGRLFFDDELAWVRAPVAANSARSSTNDVTPAALLVWLVLMGTIVDHLLHRVVTCHRRRGGRRALRRPTHPK